MNFSTITFLSNLYSLILKYNFKGKYRLLNLIRNFTSDEINLIDKQSGIKLQLKRDDAITNSLLVEKSYENLTFKKAKEILMNKYGIFVDIGANFGLYSCLLSKFASTTISIEPSPYSMCRLINNIKINDLSNEIIPVLGLLNSDKNIFGFYNNIYNQGGSRINTGKYTSELYIPSCSINDILEKFIPKYQKITLIKIDIEGEELDLLQNLDFAKFGPENIILEYEPLNNKHVKNIINLVIEKGYFIYNIDGSKFIESPKIESNLWLTKIKLAH